MVTVQQILGHRDIKTTLRYAHLAPAHKAKAVEKLGEAFGEIQRKAGTRVGRFSGAPGTNQERFASAERPGPSPNLTKSPANPRG